MQLTGASFLHKNVAGSIFGRGMMGGNQSMFLSHFEASVCLSVSLRKSINISSGEDFFLKRVYRNQNERATKKCQGKKKKGKATNGQSWNDFSNKMHRVVLD